MHPTLFDLRRSGRPARGVEELDLAHEGSVVGQEMTAEAQTVMACGLVGVRNPSQGAGGSRAKSFAARAGDGQLVAFRIDDVAFESSRGIGLEQETVARDTQASRVSTEPSRGDLFPGAGFALTQPDQGYQGSGLESEGIEHFTSGPGIGVGRGRSPGLPGLHLVEPVEIPRRFRLAHGEKDRIVPGQEEPHADLVLGRAEVAASQLSFGDHRKKLEVFARDWLQPHALVAVTAVAVSQGIVTLCQVGGQDEG